MAAPNTTPNRNQHNDQSTHQGVSQLNLLEQYNQRVSQSQERIVIQLLVHATVCEERLTVDAPSSQ
jgi:hypothetical protein